MFLYFLCNKVGKLCSVNGKKYDAIAQYIANILNGDDVRTREVNANVDIYDCEL